MTQPTPKSNLLTTAIIGAIVMVIVAAIALGGYLYTQLQPVNPEQTETTRFVVTPGAGVQQIASDLAGASLIRSPLVFRLYVTVNNMDGQLQAGSFELSESMSLTAIANRLTEGTQDTWVTLLEGWRVEQIAEYLDNQDLTVFDQQQFVILAASDEGRLYPDTYLVPKDITNQAMHSLLLNTFERKVTNDLAQEIAASERDFADVLIMASLIEREARDYQQMRHVSGILWNRIDLEMPLQVDATLQYVRGYDPVNDSWWSEPHAADKSIDSAYNTYAQPGLPPAPIANPGKNAIQAALDPLPVNDLFYLHASDGQMYYAETIEEHNANVEEYLR